MYCSQPWCFCRVDRRANAVGGTRTHGREDVFDDVDLSRTIGWFTIFLPVVLELEEASHPSDALKAVKDQLRNIPNRLGYGVRYLSKDVEPLQF